MAIALRNRYRRMQITGTLRDEITPKNILMIGPTGVGKTEIVRRLAKFRPMRHLLKWKRLNLPKWVMWAAWTPLFAT